MSSKKIVVYVLWMKKEVFFYYEEVIYSLYIMKRICDMDLGNPKVHLLVKF